MRVRRLTAWQSPAGYTQPGDVVEMDDVLGELHCAHGVAERADGEPVSGAAAPVQTDAVTDVGHYTTTTTVASTPVAPTEASETTVVDDTDRADLAAEIHGLRAKADAIALGELHGVDISPDLKLAEMKAQLSTALLASTPVAPTEASDDES